MSRIELWYSIGGDVMCIVRHHGAKTKTKIWKYRGLFNTSAGARYLDREYPRLEWYEAENPPSREIGFMKIGEL
jgi:hypothetical protein